jgi:hypothetical protein
MSDAAPSAIIYSGELSDMPGRAESWTEEVVAHADGTWALVVRATDFLGHNESEPTEEHFADAGLLIEYLRERDFEDVPSRRAGPRLSELDDFARSIGRTDVVEAIEAIRHPPRPRPPKVLAVLGTVIIGPFPSGRGRSAYLRVSTDRGPAIMSIRDGEKGIASCWFAETPYLLPPIRARLTKPVLAAAIATLASLPPEDR